jgi:MFS family permease
LNGLLNFVIAVLVYTGLIREWHVYMYTMLAGVVQALQQPTRESLVGELVPPEKLLNASGLNQAALNISRAAGPALSGVWIYYFGIAGAWFGQGLLFLFAAVWLFLLHIPAKRPMTAKELASKVGVLRSINEGIVFVWGETSVRTQTILALGLEVCVSLVEYAC